MEFAIHLASKELQSAIPYQAGIYYKLILLTSCSDAL